MEIVVRVVVEMMVMVVVVVLVVKVNESKNYLDNTDDKVTYTGAGQKKDLVNECQYINFTPTFHHHHQQNETKQQKHNKNGIITGQFCCSISCIRNGTFDQSNNNICNKARRSIQN